VNVRPDDTTVPVVSAEDIAEHISLATALRAARTAAQLRLEPDNEFKRINLALPGGWMRVLVGVLPSKGVFGYKEFHLSPGGALRYAVHLFATDDGRPLGVVDASLITTMRTAASATAAAVAYFGPEPPKLTVGVIGSGAEAAAGLRALADALPVSEVRVSSRSEANRRSFAEVMGDELGLSVMPSAGLREATDEADVVYVATNSGGHVVAGAEDLAGAPLVLSIGSTMPDQRELAGDVIAAADLVVVDTPDVLEESGDALEARERGLDLQRVCQLGRYLTERPAVAGRTLYKSIGSPEQDLVLAYDIVQQLQSVASVRRIASLANVKQNM
jgi:alanine dehydrogenase